MGPAAFSILVFVFFANAFAHSAFPPDDDDDIPPLHLRSRRSSKVGGDEPLHAVLPAGPVAARSKRAAKARTQYLANSQGFTEDSISDTLCDDYCGSSEWSKRVKDVLTDNSDYFAFCEEFCAKHENVR